MNDLDFNPEDLARAMGLDELVPEMLGTPVGLLRDRYNLIAGSHMGHGYITAKQRSAIDQLPLERGMITLKLAALARGAFKTGAAPLSDEQFAKVLQLSAVWYMMDVHPRKPNTAEFPDVHFLL